jgi:lycopene cyclase domain-containing protein
MSLPSASFRWPVLLPVVVFAAALAYWFIAVFPSVEPQLAMEVPQYPFRITWFEDNPNAYLWLNGLSFLFPFLLSFDKKVAFYRHWPSLMPAILLTGAIFLVWDVYFTRIGVWDFNPRYANHFFLGLPLGEWLFFFVVPYCCVFVYACLIAYFPQDPLKGAVQWLDYGFLLLFFGVGLSQIDRAYTSTAFLGSGLLLFWHVFWWKTPYRSRLYLAYFVCCIPFLIVNTVLTGGTTEEPVVIYTEAQNLTSLLGARCGSIPFDDFAYNFLLLALCITFKEKFDAR